MTPKAHAILIISSLISPSLLAANLIGETFASSPQTIVSKVDGVLSSAPLKLGEKVVENQLVASIETQDFEYSVDKHKSNVALVSAELTQKQSIYERYQELSSNNSLAANDLDIAKAEYLSSKAKLALAKTELKEAVQQLKDTQIVTKISGYIVSSESTVGDWISTGDAMYQVINIDQISIRLYASEYEIGSLEVGQPITLWAEADPEWLIEAKINRIGVQIDPDSMAYSVEIDIENPQHRLKPGMSMHASIEKR